MVDKSISVAITAQDKFSDVIAKYQKGLSKQSRETNNFSQKLKGSFLGAGNSLSKFQGLAKSSLGMLTRFAPALAPLGAALSIKEMSASTLEWGKNIRQMSVQSKALGVPLNRLNALSEAAETMGGSGDSVKSAISDISNKQFDAIHGLNPEATLMFKQFGIGIDELKTKRPDEIFEKISARLRDIKDESKQATASQIVFGGAAQGLLPTLQKSQDFYDKAVQASEKNFELTKGQQDTLTDLADTADQLSAQTKAIGLQMATWAAPGLKTALDWMSKLEKASSRAFTDKNDEHVLGASYLPKSVTSAIIDARKRNRIQEEKGKQESTVNPWNDIKSGFIPKAGAWLWNEGTSLLAGSAEAATIQGKKGNSLEQKRTELDQGEKAVQKDRKSKSSHFEIKKGVKKASQQAIGLVQSFPAEKTLYENKVSNAEETNKYKTPQENFKKLLDRGEKQNQIDETPYRSDVDIFPSHFKNQQKNAQIGFRNPNAVKVWNSLKSHGYSDIETAGMMSSSSAESNFNPKIVNSSGMQGIFQWNKARQKEFESLHHKKIVDAPIEEQVDFADYELKHHPYLGLKQLREAKTAKEAAYLFPRRFERPDSNWDDPKEANTRSMTGEDWLNAARDQPQEVKLIIDVNHNKSGEPVLSVKPVSSSLKISSIKQLQAMAPGTDVV
ncbi:phage tail tape measure protein [Acetobacteraceae bacterium]|nr:phage tail tape measure protein [Acetobacteraceae bacterium]